MNRSVAATAVLALGGVIAVEQPARTQTQPPQSTVLERYCVGCHNEKTRTAGLMLDKMDFAHPAQNAEAWEKVIRKIRAGMMPPSGAPRPDRTVLDGFAEKLEAELDQASAANPNPGFVGLHRLN